MNKDMDIATVREIKSFANRALKEIRLDEELKKIIPEYLWDSIGTCPCCKRRWIILQSGLCDDCEDMIYNEQD